MAIEPAATSARPAVTTIALASSAPVRPAASANGTVRPSDMPITTSRTTAPAVKWCSMWGVTGIREFYALADATARKNARRRASSRAPAVRTPPQTSSANGPTAAMASAALSAVSPPARKTGTAIASRIRRLSAQSCRRAVPPSCFTGRSGLPESSSTASTRGATSRASSTASGPVTWTTWTRRMPGSAARSSACAPEGRRSQSCSVPTRTRRCWATRDGTSCPHVRRNGATGGGTAAAIAAMRSSGMTPGPLGISETRPRAAAPALTAARASATLWMQQTFTRGTGVGSTARASGRGAAVLPGEQVGLQAVELLVELHDLQLRLQVHLVVQLAADAVAGVLAVLAHHDHGGLDRGQHREEEVQQDEGKRIERLLAHDEQRVDDDPDEQHAGEGEDEGPRSAEARHAVGHPVAEGLLLVRDLVGVRHLAPEQLVGLAEPARERGHHVQGHVRAPAEQPEELLPRQAVGLHAVQRDRGGRAASPVEERHLAEELPRLQYVHHDLRAVLAEDRELHLAAVDHVQDAAGLLLAEDGGAGREARLLHQRGDGGPLVAVQGLEERDALEHLRSRRHECNLLGNAEIDDAAGVCHRPRRPARRAD